MRCIADARSPRSRAEPRLRHHRRGARRPAARSGRAGLEQHRSDRRDGEIRARYDKAHLVPFGEYVPFRDVLPLTEDHRRDTSISAAGPGPRTIDAARAARRLRR